MTKRTFDFNSEQFKKNNPRVQLFLSGAYKSGMKEKEFAAKLKAIKPTYTSPSYIRNLYNNLLRNYNFF